MTSLDDECKHGLSPEWCSICKNIGRLTSVEVLQRRVIKAKYPSDCRGCNLPIYEGQEISGETGGEWRHSDCW